MRRLVETKVYNDARVLQVEAAGFEIIYGLLEVFAEAAELIAKHGAESKVPDTLKARKIMKLFPDSWFVGNGKLIQNPYERLLAVVDYVAGMTDTFALDLYRKLRGVALPQ